MVEVLGVQSGVLILVELLCPVCYLMCNESSSGVHAPNCSIWRLKLTHVAGVPSHFRFCGKAENNFSAVDNGCEIRDVRVNGI